MAQIKISMSPKKKEKFVTDNFPLIKRKFKGWFKVLQDTITTDRIKKTIDEEHFDNDWEDEIILLTTQFINSEFKPKIGGYIKESGDVISDIIERELRRLKKSMSYKIFNPVTENVMRYIEKAGLYYVVDATPKMIEAARISIMGMVETNYSVYNIQKMLYEIFPLRDVQHITVGKFYDSLVDEGMANDRAARMTSRYASNLRDLRAENIARTEVGRAYSFGQQESIKQTVDSGLIKNPQKQRSVIMDGREQHGDMDGEIREMDEPYSNGEMFPGEASFNCRCSENYIMEAAA